MRIFPPYLADLHPGCEPQFRALGHAGLTSILYKRKLTSEIRFSMVIASPPRQFTPKK